MKILSVASARPNFVKLAAVHHALAKRKGVEHVIVHTGQHYDPMFSDVFFEQLDLPDPVMNLGIHGGARDEVIKKTTDAMMKALKELQPDMVLVYGDVNGALGAARAAKALGIRLGHVEAGLRSFDTEMPEEHNRIAVDALADDLFCTEQSALDHLKQEQAKGAVHFVGNTMIDTLTRMMPVIEAQKNIGDFLGKQTFAVATLHRPSNVDDKKNLAANMDFLCEVGQHVRLYLLCHHRLKAALHKFALTEPWDTSGVYKDGVALLDAFPYVQFMRVVQLSSFVLTDSGGIQEETVLLKKRCFTLRKNTERPVTIECGSNVLIDIDKAKDRQTVLDFAKHPKAIDVNIPKLWDGRAGERIADILLR